MKIFQGLVALFGATMAGIVPAQAGGAFPHGTMFHRILHEYGGLDFLVAAGILGGFAFYCILRALIAIPEKEH